MNRIRPKRRWGQNFLMDPNIARNIAAYALDTPLPRQVIEIGPGQGALTGHLLSQGDPFCGIEVDPQLAGLLRERYRDAGHVRVIVNDVLDEDFSRLAAEMPDHHMTVVGNIPYNITTPILFRLFDYADNIYQAVLMMQKEVGERLCAQPSTKAYGLLAINTQLFADVERLMTVPAAVFSPRPKVDSVVMRLRFHKGVRERFADFSLFRKTLRHCFSQRRKMLRKTLSLLYDPGLLAKLDADLTRRPEHLSIDQWLQLTEAIHRLQQEKSL